MCELVDRVHADYSDLKETISKQKHDIKQDLAQQININTATLMTIAEENKHMKKENNILKERLDKIKQAQLSNNIIITSIQEGPFELPNYGYKK